MGYYFFMQDTYHFSLYGFLDYKIDLYGLQLKLGSIYFIKRIFTRSS